AQKDGTTEVRPRADVAVISYDGNFVGSALTEAFYGRDFVSLPELQMNPLAIETRQRKEIDDTGMEIEIPVQFPIWVKPKAGGGTPMCAGLRRASDHAQQWAMTDRNSY